MFKVRHKPTGEVHTIYDVQRTEDAKMRFLVYINHWVYISAENYEPLK